jgi:hypothetical protein
MPKRLNEYVEYTISQYIIKPRYKINNNTMLNICSDFVDNNFEDTFIQSSDFNLNIFTDLAIIKLGAKCKDTINHLEFNVSRLSPNGLNVLPHIWYSRPSAIEHDRFNNFKDTFKYLYSFNVNGVRLALKNKMLNWRGINMNPSRKAISLLKKNLDQLNYPQLNLNSSDWAVSLLRTNPEKIDFTNASYNSHPSIVNWFLENQKHIDWGNFIMNTNPDAIKLCISNGFTIHEETIDYKFTNQLYKFFIKMLYDVKI